MALVAAASGGDGSSSFARALASNSKKQRDGAMAALSRWLAARPSVAEADLLKVWKGMFYAMWHADKAPVQAEVAENMAAVLDACQPEVALTYLRACLTTLRREWPVIDRLRLDKYMLLVRKMLAHTFSLLARCEWRAEVVQPVCQFVRDKLLLATERAFCLGLSLHLTDVFLRELAGAPAVPADALLELLRPFVALMAAPGHTALVSRAKSALLEPMLEEGCALALQGEELLAVGELLFQTAAEEATSGKYRSELYALAKAFRVAAVARGAEAPQSERAARKRAAPADAPCEVVAQPVSKTEKVKRAKAARAATPPAAAPSAASAPPSGASAARAASSTPLSAYSSALSRGSDADARELASTPSALEGAFEDVWATPSDAAITPVGAGAASSGTPGKKRKSGAAAQILGLTPVHTPAAPQSAAKLSSSACRSAPLSGSPAKRIRWALEKNERFMPTGLPHTDAGRANLTRCVTPKPALRHDTPLRQRTPMSSGARGGGTGPSPLSGGSAAKAKQGAATPGGTPRLRAADFFL